MIEPGQIPKQTIIDFFHDLHISCKEPLIKLSAGIDIAVPGRRKFCNSRIECCFYEKYFSIKLMNKNLGPCFPTRFDSRENILSSFSKRSICIEGYSCLGKHRLVIYPALFENFLTE